MGTICWNCGYIGREGLEYALEYYICGKCNANISCTSCDKVFTGIEKYKETCENCYIEGKNKEYDEKLREAMILVVYDGQTIELNGNKIFHDVEYVVVKRDKTNFEFNSAAEAVDFFNKL